MSTDTAAPIHRIRPGVIPPISPAEPDDSALSRGWRAVETISDALALARRYAEDRATAQRQLAWIKAHCQVIYYPPSPCLPVPVQPITHYQPTGRDHWGQLMAIANHATRT